MQLLCTVSTLTGLSQTNAIPMQLRPTSIKADNLSEITNRDRRIGTPHLSDDANEKPQTLSSVILSLAYFLIFTPNTNSQMSS